MKKLAILLAALLLIGCSSMAFAVNSNDVDLNNPEPIEPDEYTGLQSIGVGIEVSSSGVISCYGSMTIKLGYTADATWVLQKTKGSTWSDMSTWTASGEGPTVLLLDRTRYAISGYTYRLKANIKVYNSNGTCVDNVTKFSPIVSYP